MAVLVLILLVIGTVEGLNTSTILKCDCDGFETKDIREEDSMHWFNMIVDSWFQTSKGHIIEMLDGIIKGQVNNMLPKWIVSLRLAHFGFEESNWPKFTNVKSSVKKVHCEGGILRQYTLDMNMFYYSQRSIADVWIQLPMGLSSLVSLNQIELSGTLRLKVLMRSDLGFPGLASATVSFLGRPELKFNVDLNNMVGLDTFGIDGWITSKIEDVALKQLVYPGAFYLDLSKLSTQQAVENILIASDPDLHAAVLSAKVEIVPNFSHHTDKQITAEFHLKGQTIQTHIMTDNSVFQFNRFLDGFSDSTLPAQIRVIEKGTFSSTTFAAFDVDVPMLIKSDYLSENFTMMYTKDKSQSWTITANISAYLLPQVPLLQKDRSVVTLNTLSGVATCANTVNTGVLLVHVHNAVGLMPSDTAGSSSGSTDPYAILFLNGYEVGRTETQANTMAPVFNKKFEILLKLKEDDEVSTLMFELWDHDKMSKDDKLGTFTINASKKTMKSMALPMLKGGILYVSTTFRPVPFIN